MFLYILASSFEVGLSLSSSLTSENIADTIKVMVTLSRVDNEPFVLDRLVTLQLSSSGDPGIVGEFSLVRLLPLLAYAAGIRAITLFLPVSLCVFQCAHFF